MKYILKFLLLILWYILVTVVIIMSKLFAIVNHVILFVSGVVWRMKPFKTEMTLTFKHLWSTHEDSGLPLTIYFRSDIVKEKLSYSDAYNWKKKILIS